MSLSHSHHIIFSSPNNKKDVHLSFQNHYHCRLLNTYKVSSQVMNSSNFFTRVYIEDRGVLAAVKKRIKHKIDNNVIYM